MLDSLRSGAVHLTGLRLLAPRLKEQNHRALLAEALESLIERVEKERFAVVRKPRTDATEVAGCASSRQVPAAIRRYVYDNQHEAEKMYGRRVHGGGAREDVEFADDCRVSKSGAALAPRVHERGGLRCSRGK
jgi:hypothetical protein